MEREQLREKASEFPARLFRGLRRARRERTDDKPEITKEQYIAYAILGGTVEKVFEDHSHNVGNVRGEERKRLVLSLSDSKHFVITELKDGTGYEIDYHGPDHFPAQIDRKTRQIVILSGEESTVCNGYEETYTPSNFNPISGCGSQETKTKLSKPAVLDSATATQLALDLVQLPANASLRVHAYADYDR